MRSGEKQEKANSKGGEGRWHRKERTQYSRTWGGGGSCREELGVTANGTGFLSGARKRL